MSKSSGGKARKTVEIVNRLGLHARAATEFVKLAATFRAEVTVRKDGECVDGKSIISLLTLSAGVGTRIEIEAHGEDAEDALAALASLVARKFDEPA